MEGFLDALAAFGMKLVCSLMFFALAAPPFLIYLFFDLTRTRSELALFTDSLAIYQHSSIVCSLLFGEECKQVAVF